MNNPSKPDASLLLRRIALVIFTIFPVTLALVAQVLFLVRTWDIFKAFQITLLFGVLLVPLVLIFTNPSFWATLGNHEKWLVFWVLAIAAGLRLVLLPLISTNFGSDMADIHSFAVEIVAGTANINNYSNISYAAYLSLTSLVLSFVYRIFGVSTTVAKSFLVFLSVLTTGLVYLASRKIAGIKAGFFAAFIYATLPSLICFTGVLTGDHLALPFLALAVLMQASLFKANPSNPYYVLAGYAACGFAIGFVEWFRPFGLILLLAVLISMFIFQLQRSTFLHLILSLSVLVVSYFTVSELAGVVIRNVFHAHMFSMSQKIGSYLLVGLNPDSRGRVTLEDGITIGETYQRYGNDYVAINRSLIQTAFARLDAEKLAKLFIQKFNVMWSNRIELFDYALFGSNDQEIVYLMADFEALLFLALTLFILISAIKSFYWGSHPAIFTMQLFLLGFALLVLLFEAQNRYVVVALPYLVMLGALGVNDVLLTEKSLPQQK